jgi:hypothetical protein
MQLLLPEVQGTSTGIPWTTHPRIANVSESAISLQISTIPLHGKLPGMVAWHLRRSTRGKRVVSDVEDLEDLQLAKSLSRGARSNENARYHPAGAQ